MSITEITEAINPIEKTQKINEIIRTVNGIQVNNSTVTFKQGGVTKGTLTTNQASDSTIDLDAGGSSVTVDSSLSTTSTNPVQNKVITNSLNGKVNTNSLTQVHCVVETYQNGTSWYRVWSDGWCEQGGTIVGSTTNNSPVSLLKQYRDVSYSVVFGNLYKAATTTATPIVANTTKTPSSFQVYDSTDANFSTYWISYGYLY